MTPEEPFLQLDDEMLEGEIVEAAEPSYSYSPLCAELKKLKDRAVRHKSEVEQRWIEDERQYWGFRQANEDDGDELPPIDNKTQAKVDIISARIGDMMFPTNDRNWTAKPTPRPTDIDGNPVDPEHAEWAAKEIQNKIDDYLNECQYARSGRKAIHDACKLGIGVMKGPYARMSTKRVVRRYQEPVMDELGQPVMAFDETGMPVPMTQPVVRLDLTQETNPASTRVDPWMWFPLPCRSMDECEGAFELHLYPKSKAVGLADHPGFDSEAVERMVAAGPKLTEHETSLMRERRKLLRNATDEQVEDFVVWEYHGPIDAEHLKAGGYEIYDEMDVYWGEVWFCGNEVLKVDLNAILGDERVPYFVIPYKRDDADLLNSYGVIRVMRDDQRAIDIVWEAMQHNSRLTAGPQVAYWKGRARPVDNDYNINGPKAWEIDDDQVTSIKDVIQFQNIESALPNLLPMYELAKANADENTQLPVIAQGEATNTVPTASGMAMVMNAQNVVQRRFAHAWDDEITIPMITRYYWWLMEFSDNDDIKVEAEIDPRGASYLLVKDMQAQHGMMALDLYSRFPQMQDRVKEEELFEMVFTFLDVPTDRIFRTDEEMADMANNPEAQAQQAQVQLEMEKAQAEMRKLNAEAMRIEAEVQSAMNPDGAVESLQYQQTLMELEARMMIAQMQRDARLAEVAADKEIKVTELQAKLQTAEQDRAMKETIERMRLALKGQEAQMKQYNEGVKARVQMERKRLREERQEMMQENLNRGHDTF